MGRSGVRPNLAGNQHATACGAQPVVQDVRWGSRWWNGVRCERAEGCQCPTPPEPPVDADGQPTSVAPSRGRSGS
jgi:hypothetical protein